jgi:hypothetical protein
MAKRVKAEAAQKGRDAALKAALGGLSLMLAGAGLPAQVRLASREAQPRPIGPPKKRRGR